MRISLGELLLGTAGDAHEGPKGKSSVGTFQPLKQTFTVHFIDLNERAPALALGTLSE